MKGVPRSPWILAQIPDINKFLKKKAETKTQFGVEVAHMLMHNHNVQYPNLRDYRKIEQWQGHKSIPIMVALLIISYQSCSILSLMTCVKEPESQGQMESCLHRKSDKKLELMF